MKTLKSARYKILIPEQIDLCHWHQSSPPLPSSHSCYSPLSEISNNPSATPSPRPPPNRKKGKRKPLQTLPKNREIYLFLNLGHCRTSWRILITPTIILLSSVAMKKNCAMELDANLQTLKKPTLLLLPLHKSWGVGLGPSSKSLGTNLKLSTNKIA